MIRPAWDLVVTGVRAGMICTNQLGEVLTCLRDGRGLTLQEIDFDVVGERVDVSLLGSSCTTDRQELSWCLQALAQSVGAPPYERQQALYTRVVTERIEETTVGDLGDTQVGAANALDADYRLPDGRTVRGPTMALYPFGTDEKHRLGPGSQLTLDGVVWTVHAVELAPVGFGARLAERPSVPIGLRGLGDRVELELYHRAHRRRALARDRPRLRPLRVLQPRGASVVHMEVDQNAGALRQRRRDLELG